MEIGLNHYLIVGAVLFVCGIICMATKRNAIGVLMGVELVLNGANINFVAFSRYTPLWPAHNHHWTHKRKPIGAWMPPRRVFTAG